MEIITTIKKPYLFKKDYFRVRINFDSDSAYEYTKDSEVLFNITYQRYFDGKIEKGKIIEKMTYEKFHEIMFLIKRGADVETIKNRY